MQTIKPLIAGNWKMNGLRADLAQLERCVAALATSPTNDVEMAICVPATLLHAATTVVSNSSMALGGQDCAIAASGAHTGDISAEMLADAGASYVIVGHSERRADHSESDNDVQAKAGAVIRAGLVPIICVGESEAQRAAGDALKIVELQLLGSIPPQIETGRIIVAYEPIWAIGTGLVPTLEDIAAMHQNIRALLVKRFGEVGQGIALLYGGSMKPGNAAEILAIDDVNGGLVGGASLKADDFITIIRSAHKA